MGKKRFFIDGVVGGTYVLDGDNHRHIMVTRTRVGDEVVLCVGDGIDHMGIVSGITKSDTKIDIIRSAPNLTEPGLDIDLYFAPIATDNTELVIIKGTELGVTSFVPIVTKHTQASSIRLRYDRLSKLILESCKQCGRGVLPTVQQAVSISDALNKLPELGYDIAVLCYENERRVSLAEAVSNYNGSIQKAAIFVGPEGGYTSEEAAIANQAGLLSVTLGKRILRAETASIAAVSQMLALSESKK